MDTYPRKQNSYNEKKKKISESIGYNIQTHSRNR